MDEKSLELEIIPVDPALFLDTDGEKLEVKLSEPQSTRLSSSDDEPPITNDE